MRRDDYTFEELLCIRLKKALGRPRTEKTLRLIERELELAIREAVAAGLADRAMVARASFSLKGELSVELLELH
jgi:hypothetical protein